MYPTSQELSEIANALIIKTYKDNIPARPDMEKVARAGLGLNVIYEDIAEKDSDIVAFVADGHTPVKVKSNGKISDVIFPRGTIVIDNFLKKHGSKDDVDFAIAHECGHIICSGFDSTGLCFKRNFDPEKEYSIEELSRHFDIQESMANSVAYALRMPSVILNCLINKYNRGRKIHIYGEVTTDMRTKRVLDNIMKDMGVTYKALLIQLKKNGLTEQHSMDEYLSIIAKFAGGTVNI